MQMILDFENDLFVSINFIQHVSVNIKKKDNVMYKETLICTFFIRAT